MPEAAAMRLCSLYSTVSDCAPARSSRSTWSTWTGERELLAVRQKGGGERRQISLPEEVLAAIVRWVEVRGPQPGALFIALADGGRGRLPNLPPADAYRRMTRSALERVVRRWSQVAGVKVRPHGLRHTAITECLDAGHDVRHVSRFARHASVATTIAYDDNRTDINGKVAAAHTARLEAARKKLEAEGSSPKRRRSGQTSPGARSV